MTSRTIRTGDDVVSFQAWLTNMPFPYTVTVTKGVKRSTDQNRLQRVWVNQIAAELDNGDTAENVRGLTKLHVGVPIMRAASEAYQRDYDEIIRPLPYPAKLRLMQVPIDFPVTRDMTVPQKTQYLEGMQQFWAERGVVLENREGAI